MNAIKKAGHARDVDYSAPTDADRVRDLISRIGTSQRGAAKELDINERTLRGYCAGDRVPKVVMLALERLADLSRHTGENSNKSKGRES